VPRIFPIWTVAPVSIEPTAATVAPASIEPTAATGLLSPCVEVVSFVVTGGSQVESAESAGIGKASFPLPVR